MKKVVSVLGARPQFIKASVVSQAIRASGALSEVLVHTGQHFDANMSDVFFAELGMRAPEHELGIHGGGHGAMTGQMLAAVERVLIEERPAAVLVYGDTNSTLAGARNRLAPPTPVPVLATAIGSRGADVQPCGSGDAAARIVVRLSADLAA
jgi:UDP-GlcNAc3NAcA epimerase